MLARKYGEAVSGDLLAEEACVLAEALTQVRRFGQQIEDFERRGNNRGCDRVRKEVGTGALAEQFDDFLARAGISSTCSTQRLAQSARNDIHAAFHAAKLRCAATVFSDETDCVGVVHHDHGIVLVGQVAYPIQLGEVAVHRENAIGCDEAVPRRLRFHELLFEIAHVAVPVAESLSFRQPDPVDDAGMVQLVGDDRVFRIQQRFKQTAVGIETGAVKDGVFRAEKFADFFFKLLVDRLRPADESHAGEAIAPVFQCLLRGPHHRRMIRQAQVVVCAKVQYGRAIGDGNLCLLRSGNDALPFIQARVLDLGDLFLEIMLSLAVHVEPFLC